MKWFFGKDDDDVGLLTLATTLSPQTQVTSFFQEFKDKEGKVIKPKYVNLQKWIRARAGQKEKDYISGLDELAKGVEQGDTISGFKDNFERSGRILYLIPN